MNIRVLLLFSLLPLFVWPQLPKYMEDVQSVRERIKTDISILASDSLEGRESGQDGARKAYQYIVHQFEEIGLGQKGNDKSSFLQAFSYDSFDNTGRWKKNYLVCDNKTFANYRDFGPTRFSADTVAAGNLIVLQPYFIQAEKGVSGMDTSMDLHNKVLLLDIVPYLIPGSQEIDFPFFKESISGFFSRGVNAILLWDRDQGYHQELFDFGVPDPMPGPVVFVNYTTARFFLKHAGIGVKASVQKPRLSRLIFYNVVGEIEHHAGKTVIIGAHYDHLGKGAGKGRHRNDNGIMHGADDNASGTAGLLELARHYSMKADTTVNYLFVAFSGEEEGLIGSEYFCSHFPSGTEPVLFMVNFDMIGRLGCEGNRVTALGEGSSPCWKNLYHDVPHTSFRLKARMGGAGVFRSLSFSHERDPCSISDYRIAFSIPHLR